MSTEPPTTLLLAGAIIVTVGASVSIVIVMLSTPTFPAKSIAFTYIVYWPSARFVNVWVVDVPTLIHPVSHVEL